MTPIIVTVNCINFQTFEKSRQIISEKNINRESNEDHKKINQSRNDIINFNQLHVKKKYQVFQVFLSIYFFFYFYCQ